MLELFGFTLDPSVNAKAAAEAWRSKSSLGFGGSSVTAFVSYNRFFCTQGFIILYPDLAIYIYIQKTSQANIAYRPCEFPSLFCHLPQETPLPLPHQQFERQLQEHHHRPGIMHGWAEFKQYRYWHIPWDDQLYSPLQSSNIVLFFMNEHVLFSMHFSRI